MPNWCATRYAVTGDKQQIAAIYETMKRLQNMKEPSVPNGFGPTWLGCLVHSLGKDWHNTWCRGEWSNLRISRDRQTIFFNTMTAWGPANDTFDALCEVFQDVSYFYSAEEPGCCYYETNDEDGVFFPERYLCVVNTPEHEYESHYSKSMESAFKWLSKISGKKIKTKKDLDDLCKEWEAKDPDAFIQLNRFELSC